MSSEEEDEVKSQSEEEEEGQENEEEGKESESEEEAGGDDKSRPVSARSSGAQSVGQSSQKELIEAEEGAAAAAADDDEMPQQTKTGCLAGMWSSRDMLKDNNDQQLFVKVTLRELIVYVFFLVIINYITFGQYTEAPSQMSVAFQALFGSQLEVRNMRQFWDFVEGDLVNGIYWDTLYNKGYRKTKMTCPDKETRASKPCPVPPKDRNIMYENRVLGLARIRQLKVTNKSCTIEPSFRGAIKVCYAPYAEAYEDKGSYNPDFRKYSSETAWKYHSADELGGTSSYWGQIATYSGNGYYQDFHYLKNETQAIISEMKKGLWITQGTRFVSIDFTVYNANINLFCVIQMTFEFPPTGGVIPFQAVSSIRLLKYIDRSDYIMMGAELIFIIFIAYYIIEEGLEIKAHGLAHFKKATNWMDIVVIVISSVQIALNLYMTLVTPSKLAPLLEKPFQFPDFSVLATLNEWLNVAQAFNIYVAWAKLFKYLSFNKTMSQLNGTLSATAADLSGFLVMFIIIYMAFVQLGYLLFGIQIYEFSDPVQTSYTLFRMILGDFNFRAIKIAGGVIGTCYFLAYIFFVFFVLLNMFLAIIGETYAVVKEDIQSKTADFTMADFFKTGVNNTKGYLGILDRGIDVENAIKLAAADDGFVTYDELRENLRKARFSDVEIDLFFHMFKNDPAIAPLIIEEEEIIHRIPQNPNTSFASGRPSAVSARRSAHARRQSVLDGSAFFEDERPDELRPKSGREGRKLRSARVQAEIRAEDQVLDSEFYGLEDRVDRMELTLVPLSYNLDAVLTRLDGVQKDRKLRKKDLEQIFDSIVADESGWQDKLVDVCNKEKAAL